MRRRKREPYFDVSGEPCSFTIPRLKWREILFVGALVRSGEHYVRDPSRPLPPFRNPDLFPSGALFRVTDTEEGDRVRIVRIGENAPG